MKRLLTVSACVCLAFSAQAEAQSSDSIPAADEGLERSIAPIIAKYTSTTAPADSAATAGRSLHALAVFPDPITALVPQSDSLELPAEWLSSRERFAVLFGRDWKGFNGETWGRDTLLFVPLVSAMPEPETWLSLILGFGLVGAALRRGRADRRMPGQA